MREELRALRGEVKKNEKMAAKVDQNGKEDDRILRIKEGVVVVKEGQFMKGIVNKVVFPASLKALAPGAFKNWKTLEEVEFNENGQLEKLGKECF